MNVFPTVTDIEAGADNTFTVSFSDGTKRQMTMAEVDELMQQRRPAVKARLQELENGE